MIRDSCGVVGVMGKNASEYVYRGMITLQHRGQDSCGISSYDSKERMFKTKRGYGLVTEVLNFEKSVIICIIIT